MKKNNQPIDQYPTVRGVQKSHNDTTLDPWDVPELWLSILPDESWMLYSDEMDALAESFKTSLGQEAELHPTLKPWLITTDTGREILEHPICRETAYAPMLNAMINSQYLARQSAVADFLFQVGAGYVQEPEAWAYHLDMYATPHRLRILEAMAPSMDSRSYWWCLAYVWMETENHHQLQKVIPRAWFQSGHGEPILTALMTPDELRVYNALPDEPITVYRGYTYPEAKRGWSWSFSPAVARRFALAFASISPHEPKIIEGQVTKRDIMAFFDGRNEREAVIEPSKPTRLKTLTISDYPDVGEDYFESKPAR